MKGTDANPDPKLMDHAISLYAGNYGRARFDAFWDSWTKYPVIF